MRCRRVLLVSADPAFSEGGRGVDVRPLSRQPRARTRGSASARWHPVAPSPAPPPICWRNSDKSRRRRERRRDRRLTRSVGHICAAAACSWSAPTLLSPKAAAASMCALYPANLAQEREEVLRRDGILLRHLQRRRPFAGRLLIHLRQSRADQYQWQGGAWRNRKLGLASKLALGDLTQSVRSTGAAPNRPASKSRIGPPGEGGPDLPTHDAPF